VVLSIPLHHTFPPFNPHARTTKTRHPDNVPAARYSYHYSPLVPSTISHRLFHPPSVPLFCLRSRNYPSRTRQPHQTLYIATRPAHTSFLLGLQVCSPIVCIRYLDSFLCAHKNHVSFLYLLSQAFALLFKPDHKSLSVAMFPHVVLVLFALFSSVCFLPSLVSLPCFPLFHLCSVVGANTHAGLYASKKIHGSPVLR